MVMKEHLEVLRKFDLFAVPISLSYKGKKEFSTKCGGFASLLIMIIFSLTASFKLYTYMTNPQFYRHTAQLDYSVDREPYRLDTNEATLAISVSSHAKGFEPD